MQVPSSTRSVTAAAAAMALSGSTRNVPRPTVSKNQIPWKPTASAFHMPSMKDRAVAVR